MKNVLFLTVIACCLLTSCLGDMSGLFGGSGSTYSLEGKWGMVSGGIERNGVFSGLDSKDDYYKTMEFNEDGTFVEECGDLRATGTYTVQGSSTISYTYSEVPGDGPAYFAIHNSGTWMYVFWNANSFTLYDYSSRSLEISMTFSKISVTEPTHERGKKELSSSEREEGERS